jgi:predicted RNA methylase
LLYRVWQFFIGILSFYIGTIMFSSAAKNLETNNNCIYDINNNYISTKNPNEKENLLENGNIENVNKSVEKFQESKDFLQKLVG